ncbi:DUF1700 domain-containing protein [Enterococcus dongliensis]|uniref:DUF1700 domain-containing protein n=1 Tax=Enterococcus dongliensis TaxID=2559925 RepID=UPI00288F8116|nr:DUF1700 domain-containing protein [Enterococcus dongliensis]MDT2674550.1 DUF1700 domain-containing protein [Enterococcus dongliensis]MDT2702465.1 DUF1700 domain-containing protein [Enterococcus dongliensis]
MNREEFIKAFSNYLAYEVRPNEIQRLIDYYDEMILDLIEDGYSEKAAVAKLGDPKQLADEAIGVGTEVKVPRRFTWLWIVLLILGFPLWGSLALAFFLILLSIDIVIWCIPFTGACLAGGTIIGGVVAAFTSPFVLFDSFFMGISQLGIGMLLFGFGLLCMWVTYKFSAVFITMHYNLMRIIRRNIFQRKVVSI